MRRLAKEHPITGELAGVRKLGRRVTDDCEGECCEVIDCDEMMIADPFDMGGCCFPDGSCAHMHRCECAEAGGFFKGRFVTCAMLPACAQPPGGGPGPGGGEPPEPRMCVHFYESQIQCLADGQGGFVESPAPVNRTRSNCEACGNTPSYPDGGPDGGTPSNQKWVRESRADGSDYWVFKYCDHESSCSTKADCQSGGPDPSEFGVSVGLPTPPTPMQQPGTISDYCANQTHTGPGNPPPYDPTMPGYYEPSHGLLAMPGPPGPDSPAAPRRIYPAMTARPSGGCGACKDEGAKGLEL